MATSRVSKAAADAAKARAATVDARRTVLSRDVFLRSQGPKVIEIDLPNWRLKVLMKRVDVLGLTRAERYPEPITSRVVEIVRKGGLIARDKTGEVTYDATDSENLIGTLDVAAAIAIASIIVPPPEYVDGTIDAGDIDPRMCKPLFVCWGDEPDEDQVVLDYILPEEKDHPDYDEDTELARGRMHPVDLYHILERALYYGPGALGATFREASDPVAVVDQVAVKRATRRTAVPAA